MADTREEKNLFLLLMLMQKKTIS